MTAIEHGSRRGAEIVADAREYVLYSWSVPDLNQPIPVSKAKGRYFWDYDGKRYLDFASQLVNVNIGHQHPKIIARYRSYHGATHGAVTLTGDPRRWAIEPGMPGVVRMLDPYTYRCPAAHHHA